MSDNDSSTTAGFLVRRPPVFDTVEDERRHRLERLAGACRIFGRAGFSEGLLGHLTVRDPEFPDRFWANPLGISFNRIRVCDLVQVDHEGSLIHGEVPVNPVGVRLHAAVHRARPEVVAVCHAHSTFGSAWSAFGRPVDPITQDTCVFFEQQAIIGEPRVALDEPSAAQFADAFGDKPVAIQTGHGIFATGRSVDEAAWRFISLDKACHVQLLADIKVERFQRRCHPDSIAHRVGHLSRVLIAANTDNKRNTPLRVGGRNKQEQKHKRGSNPL